eukprot:TRINITY_DN669_c0_g1_i2.p1 TRINITY_DN669_c0_g1~~TRINITY_DN669_c0_g1_i2.p1  ORF type:complete len:124 (-),score=37.86 TRINITY_DN669_c0_g1_i2:76-447(-)
MPGSAHVSYSTSAVLVAGGVFAFAKRKSMPSLIGGVGAGLLMALSGFLISNDQEFGGHLLGALTGATIGSVMMVRAVKTKKVMPAGAVSALLGLAGLYNGAKFKEYYEIHRQAQLDSQINKKL